MDERWASWLYHATEQNTYTYQIMDYIGRSVSELDKGPVLICFKEPAEGKGRRNSRLGRLSATPTTGGLMRRIVPYSQIISVLEYCHTGALGASIHHGLSTTWDRLNSEFDGVSRDMARLYV